MGGCWGGFLGSVGSSHPKDPLLALPVTPNPSACTFSSAVPRVRGQNQRGASHTRASDLAQGRPAGTPGAHGLLLAEALSGEGGSVALRLSTALGRLLSCSSVQTWTPLGRRDGIRKHLVSEDQQRPETWCGSAGGKGQGAAASQPGSHLAYPPPTLRAPLPPPCSATPCS